MLRPDGLTTSSALSPPMTHSAPASVRELPHEARPRHLRTRIRGLFRDTAGLCLHRDLPARDGLVHLLCRAFLRQRRRQSLGLLWLPPLALSVSGAGRRHAAVGGGTPARHY